MAKKITIELSITFEVPDDMEILQGEKDAALLKSGVQINPDITFYIDNPTNPEDVLDVRANDVSVQFVSYNSCKIRLEK